MNWNLRLQCKTDILRGLVGTTNKNAHPGKWPVTTEAKVSEVCVAFVHGSRKSRTWTTQQLWVPQSTMQKILWACLIFKLWNQLLQHVIPQDTDIHYKFCCNVLSKHDDDKFFTTKIIFCNEVTFHLSRHINQNSVRIWTVTISIQWLKVQGTSQILMSFVLYLKRKYLLYILWLT